MKKLTISTKVGVMTLVLTAALAQSSVVNASFFSDMRDGLASVFGLTRGAVPVAVAPAGNYDAEIKYDAADIAAQDGNKQQGVVTALGRVEKMKAAATYEVAGYLYDKHIAAPLENSSKAIADKVTAECAVASGKLTVNEQLTDLTTLANNTSLEVVDTTLKTKVVDKAKQTIVGLNVAGLGDAFEKTTISRTKVDIPLSLTPVAKASVKVFEGVQAACELGLDAVKGGAEATLLEHMNAMYTSSARSLTKYRGNEFDAAADAADAIK